MGWFFVASAPAGGQHGMGGSIQPKEIGLVSEQKSEPKRGPSLLIRLKIIGVAVLALLVLIVVLQNTEAVETRILFMKITMPQAVLLFGALIAGFILGIVTCNRVFAKKK